MACACKRTLNELEKNGKVITKKLAFISKLVTIPISIVIILLVMPLLTLYLIYSLFVKESTIVIPKKLMKYFE